MAASQCLRLSTEPTRHIHSPGTNAGYTLPTLPLPKRTMPYLPCSEFLLVATTTAHTTSLTSGVPVVSVVAASGYSYFSFTAVDWAGTVLSVNPMSGSPAL